MNNVIVIYRIGSSILYSLSSGIYGILIITQGVRIRYPCPTDIIRTLLYIEYNI